MISGHLAARAASISIREKNYSARCMKQYEKLWRDEIGTDLAKSVRIQKFLLSDTSRIDRIVSLAARDERIAQLLIGYTTGTIGYEELRRGALYRILPSYVWQKTLDMFGK